MEGYSSEGEAEPPPLSNKARFCVGVDQGFGDPTGKAKIMEQDLHGSLHEATYDIKYSNIPKRILGSHANNRGCGLWLQVSWQYKRVEAQSQTPTGTGTISFFHADPNFDATKEQLQCLVPKESWGQERAISRSGTTSLKLTAVQAGTSREQRANTFG